MSLHSKPTSAHTLQGHSTATPVTSPHGLTLSKSRLTDSHAALQHQPADEKRLGLRRSFPTLFGRASSVSEKGRRDRGVHSPVHQRPFSAASIFDAFPEPPGAFSDQPLFAPAPLYSDTRSIISSSSSSLSRMKATALPTRLIPLTAVPGDTAPLVPAKDGIPAMDGSPRLTEGIPLKSQEVAKEIRPSSPPMPGKPHPLSPTSKKTGLLSRRVLPPFAAPDKSPRISDPLPSPELVSRFAHMEDAIPYKLPIAREESTEPSSKEKILSVMRKPVPQRQIAVPSSSEPVAVPEPSSAHSASHAALRQPSGGRTSQAASQPKPHATSVAIAKKSKISGRLSKARDRLRPSTATTFGRPSTAKSDICSPSPASAPDSQLLHGGTPLYRPETGKSFQSVSSFGQRRGSRPNALKIDGRLCRVEGIEISDGEDCGTEENSYASHSMIHPAVVAARAARHEKELNKEAEKSDREGNFELEENLLKLGTGIREDRESRSEDGMKGTRQSDPTPLAHRQTDTQGRLVHNSADLQGLNGKASTSTDPPTEAIAPTFEDTIRSWRQDCSGRCDVSLASIEKALNDQARSDTTASVSGTVSHKHGTEPEEQSANAKHTRIHAKSSNSGNYQTELENALAALEGRLSLNLKLPTRLHPEGEDTAVARHDKPLLDSVPTSQLPHKVYAVEQSPASPSFGQAVDEIVATASFPSPELLDPSNSPASPGTSPAPHQLPDHHRVSSNGADSSLLSPADTTSPSAASSIQAEIKSGVRVPLSTVNGRTSLTPLRPTPLSGGDISAHVVEQDQEAEERELLVCDIDGYFEAYSSSVEEFSPIPSLPMSAVQPNRLMALLSETSRYLEGSGSASPSNPTSTTVISPLTAAIKSDLTRSAVLKQDTAITVEESLKVVHDLQQRLTNQVRINRELEYRLAKEKTKNYESQLEADAIIKKLVKENKALIDRIARLSSVL